MAANLCSFFCNSLSRWFSTVVIFAVGSVLIFPQQAFCLIADLPENKALVSDVLKYSFEGDADSLIATFDNLEKHIELSENPIREIQGLFQLLVDEVSSRYSLSLTLEEACNQVRNNIVNLQFTEETKTLVLETIAMVLGESYSNDYSEKDSTNLQISDIASLKTSWSRNLSWLGLNKKSKKRTKEKHSTSTIPLALQTKGSDIELPGSFYTGGVEALAGALVFTLGIVFPPAYGVGSALMVDGTRRVLNGLEEVEKDRCFTSQQQLR